MRLRALELRPDLAKVGIEICVIGNDSGEKLSVLQGVISRLDRNAPEYNGYHDFNTNYIQASAAASGGSSGSPVINTDGYVIALQAGGKSKGTTNYFLPLDRPLRALECIKNNNPVARGTIQTQWSAKPFDECRRLGLPASLEAAVRLQFPSETGMLVASRVLPEGPADKRIQPGDILAKLGGKILTQFQALDAALDAGVGEGIVLFVYRNGKEMELELEVGDLHAITPDRFVTVAGGVFHDMSYQQAYAYGISVQGVYACDASFNLPGVLIESINHLRTPNLDTFVKVMNGIPDQARVAVAYQYPQHLHVIHRTTICINRRWKSELETAIRNDSTGLWDFDKTADSLPSILPVPQTANFERLGKTLDVASGIMRSYVKISSSMPVVIEGFPRPRCNGYGVVVDAKEGLVITSRSVIPHDLCDIYILIADSIMVDAKVIFLHHFAGYAVVRYNSSLVHAPVQDARLSASRIEEGTSATFFGFLNDRPAVATTKVVSIAPFAAQLNPSAPRYRVLNIEAVTVDAPISRQCDNGVLLDKNGDIAALWISYLGESSKSHYRGLAASDVLLVVSQIRSGSVPALRILNIAITVVNMFTARVMGVAEFWIQKIEQESPFHHQLFKVYKIDCAAPGDLKAQSLKEGDVILTLDDRLITSISDLDITYTATSLNALVVRDGVERALCVHTIPDTDIRTTYVLQCCGMILHRPYHAVRQYSSKLCSEVYINACDHGSPSRLYGALPTNNIIKVNDIPTLTLTDFLKEVQRIPDNKYFRLTMVDLNLLTKIVTMKKNERYFPTVEFVKETIGAG
jgi:S1-C subfamily serine protease